MKTVRSFLITCVTMALVFSLAACNSSGANVTSISIEGAESVTVNAETQYFATVWVDKETGTALTYSVTWAIEGENRIGAVIDTNGILTAATPGAITISATAGKVKQIKEITVETIGVQSVLINGASSALVNYPVFCTAEVVPANATNKTVTWAIEGENRIGATISADGVFRAAAQGRVTICATAGTIKEVKEISVSISVRIIAIDGPSTVEAGVQTQYAALVSPANATQADNITWAIEGTNTVGAAIDSNGNLTASTHGAVTISAAAGGKKDTKTVTIYPSEGKTH